MNEIERIVDRLDRAHRGPAWHGPAVTEHEVPQVREQSPRADDVAVQCATGLSGDSW